MISTVDCLLLDYVSEYQIPIDILVQPNVGEILNNPDHNLNVMELASHLHNLVNEKFITIGKSDISVVSFNDILNILKRMSKSGKPQLNLTRKFEVKLTKKGGEIWESIFQPIWNKYCVYTVTYGETEEDEVEWIIEQPDLTLLKGMIALRKKYLVIKDNEIHLQRVRPWNATYWKMLPEVYQAHFIVVEDHSLEMSIDDRVELDDRLLSWRRRWKFPDDILELE